MLPAISLSTAEVLDALAAAVDAAGSQRAFTRNIGLSQAYVADVLAENRQPGERVLEALGLKRIVIIAAVEDIK